MKKVLALVTVFLILVACGDDPLSPSLNVRYEVTGSADKVNIDYIDQDGNLAILNGVDVPWETTIVMNKGDTVFISAQRTGDSGSVTVKIYSNGNLLAEKTTNDGTPAEVEVSL